MLSSAKAFLWQTTAFCGACTRLFFARRTSAQLKSSDVCAARPGPAAQRALSKGQNARLAFTQPFQMLISFPATAIDVRGLWFFSPRALCVTRGVSSQWLCGAQIRIYWVSFIAIRQQHKSQLSLRGWMQWFKLGVGIKESALIVYFSGQRFAGKNWLRGKRAQVDISISIRKKLCKIYAP